MFLPSVDRIYLTRIYEAYSNADTFFPEFDESEFVETKRTEFDHPVRHSFVVLDRH